METSSPANPYRNRPMESSRHNIQDTESQVDSSNVQQFNDGTIEPQHLTFTLQFLEWQGLYEIEKPFQIFINVPKDAEDPRDTNLVFKSVDVKVHDVRGHLDKYTLDDHGFMYRQHSTVVSDFANRNDVVNSYLPEVEALLRRELDGVDRVFFFDWRVCKIHI